MERGRAAPSARRLGEGACNGGMVARAISAGNPSVSAQYHTRTDPGRLCPGPIRRVRTFMNCSDLVARFTDYLDGTASSAEVAEIEHHLDGCTSCGRYRNVLEHGADLLRALPDPEIREDFTPRLEHRLYHVDDERMLGAHSASGAPALTVLGIALLLTAVAWSPTLFSGSPMVELAPIVVDRAPKRSSLWRAGMTPPGTFSTSDQADLAEGLWANTLLYDYSPLSQRYDQRTRGRRIGLIDR